MQAKREGFELDNEFSVVFERFEVVWPLDGTDMITRLKGDGKDRHPTPRQTVIWIAIYVRGQGPELDVASCNER